MMTMAKFVKLLDTVRHLKPIQFFFFGYYAVLKKLNRYGRLPAVSRREVRVVSITSPSSVPQSWTGERRFRFLNLEYEFAEIDWNYAGFGKLWTYQLNYFEFLHQADVSKQNGIKIILDYVRQRHSLRDGLEPYCISLRTIQWIKFLSLHGIVSEEINEFMYAQVRLLQKRLELHIQANHLLENALALTAAGYFFNDPQIKQESSRLLKRQLEEQFLQDGAHFERTPMYQLILINRILDVTNILQSYRNESDSPSLLDQLRSTVCRMMGWLDTIEVNGQLPAFQDSTNIPPLVIPEVKAYARRLGLSPEEVRLSDSLYRRFTCEDFTLLIDVGSPAPDFQPGHAHAGILSFVLFQRSQPVIVDPGISTYEPNTVRLREKSTCSHNTIAIAEEDQSQLWGAFRMGRRAQATIAVDTPHCVRAMHNGYRSLGVLHSRTVSSEGNRLIIEDDLSGVLNLPARLFLHFHPDRVVSNDRQSIMADNLRIDFEEPVDILLEPYYFADDFNSVRKATRATISVYKKMRMTLNGKENM